MKRNLRGFYFCTIGNLECGLDEEIRDLLMKSDCPNHSSVSTLTAYFEPLFADDKSNCRIVLLNGHSIEHYQAALGDFFRKVNSLANGEKS